MFETLCFKVPGSPDGFDAHLTYPAGLTVLKLDVQVSPMDRNHCHVALNGFAIANSMPR